MFAPSRRLQANRPSVLCEMTFGPRFELVDGQAHAYVERGEGGVEGTGFIEAHFVNELLEDDGVVGEEIDAPLPVIEADGAADDLADAVAVTAANHAVVVHEALALVEGERVPVLIAGAQAVHGIEADVLCCRDRRKEALGHGFLLTVENFLDGGVPLGRVLFETLFSERGVGLAGGLIKAELNDGEVGELWLEEVVEGGLGQGQLDTVEVFDGVAEVDEHEVALVPQDG